MLLDLKWNSHDTWLLTQNILQHPRALDACETTNGFAPIGVRAKMNVVDQSYGPPVSAAFGLELRHGDHTADSRARLTNLGEGTFDAGLFASVGRSGGLPGSGYYYTDLDVLGRYRAPNN